MLLFAVVTCLFILMTAVIDCPQQCFYNSRHFPFSIICSFINAERILESSYHGLIKENETFVEIRPLIKVDSTKVCDFHIIKKDHDVPFKIELVNNLGVLEATKTLNCEKHINYRFGIAAVLCDGTKSKRYV